MIPPTRLGLRGPCKEEHVYLKLLKEQMYNSLVL